MKKVKSRFSALGQQHYKQTQPTYLTPAEKQETWHKCRGEHNYMIHANYYYYATYEERHQVKHFMKLYLGLNSICWIVLSYLTSKLLSNSSTWACCYDWILIYMLLHYPYKLNLNNNKTVQKFWSSESLLISKMKWTCKWMLRNPCSRRNLIWLGKIDTLVQTKPDIENNL